MLSLISVIVATQSDSEQDEIAALENGATDFVSKPYRPQIIRHRVASLIKLRETAAMLNQFKLDRLTGLYSKEFFYRTVKERLEKEPEKEFTLLCSNIENFRLYNDTFGRKAVDKLLMEAAAIFRERVSESSVCCRYSADRSLLKVIVEMAHTLDLKVVAEGVETEEQAENNKMRLCTGIFLCKAFTFG